VIEILGAAENYQINDLRWRCEEEVLGKISSKNVVGILTKFYKPDNFFNCQGDETDGENNARI
jgi:hypothetical protein